MKYQVHTIFWFDNRYRRQTSVCFAAYSAYRCVNKVSFRAIITGTLERADGRFAPLSHHSSN